MWLMYLVTAKFSLVAPVAVADLWGGCGGTPSVLTAQRGRAARRGHGAGNVCYPLLTASRTAGAISCA